MHNINLELEKIGFKKFLPVHHFFGYEGRCGYPSRFDATYTFCLGYTAMLLIAHGKTGYIASVKNLVEKVDKW